MSGTTLSNAITPAKQFNLFAEDDKTIQERFVKFHTEFPKVYDLFKAFALQLVAKGHKGLGGRMIIERIRWEFATDNSKDAAGFKINNYFIAHYVRMFINEYPELAERFETRQIKVA